MELTSFSDERDQFARLQHQRKVALSHGRLAIRYKAPGNIGTEDVEDRWLRHRQGAIACHVTFKAVAGCHWLMDVFGFTPERLIIPSDQPPSGRRATAAFK